MWALQEHMAPESSGAIRRHAYQYVSCRSRVLTIALNDSLYWLH